MTLPSGAENSTTTLQDSLSETPLETIEEAVTGNNPYTFRVAQAKFDEPPTPSVRVENAPQRTADELNQLEPSFSQHASITGQPFTASYYQLDKVYRHLDLSHQVQLKRIDQYISEKMVAEHLLDKVEVAVGILQELESTLGVTPQHDPYWRIEKLANYLTAHENYTKHESLRSLLTGQRNRSPQGRFI